jgi:eukaryotic-like serine/threonine-protein kinase
MPEEITTVPVELIDHRYRLREQLGAGGFGVVHRAEHRVLGVTLREVALKLFSPEKVALTPEELLHDALELIAVLDRCQDPVLRDLFVFCYDAGVTADPPGRAYVTMEYVAGGDLAGRIGGHALPVPLALDYARAIARATAFMHDLGHLHRDLKPANVLVTTEGRVKLADFGLAVATDSLLRTAPAAGTIVYQPPEALAFQQSTPAADVYGIGLICYEMLTGALPYPPDVLSDDPDIGSLIECKMAPPDPLSRRNLELRSYPELEQVVLTALDTKGSRYPDAAALLEALEAAAAEKVVHRPRRETPWQRIDDLLAQSRAALRRADVDRAAGFAQSARELNAALSDEEMIAAVYPLLVDLARERGEPDEAVRIAQEGLRRRRCRDTYAAMARAHRGTELEATFARRAREVPA